MRRQDERQGRTTGCSGALTSNVTGVAGSAGAESIGRFLREHLAGAFDAFGADPWARKF